MKVCCYKKGALNWILLKRFHFTLFCYLMNHHSTQRFDDNMQMTCLLNVLDGKAKKAVQTIGTSSIFYATTSKTLKKFRKFFIDITFSSKIFVWQTSNSSNLITLGQFHRELKLTILMSVGCKESVFSSGNLTKYIIHLP